MIRKYTYGAPLRTDAVTSEIPAESGALSYGAVCTKDGFSFTYTMDSDAVVYGLGEANRDISHLEVTVKDMGMPGYFMRIRDGLQAEMDAGRLRHVPIHDVLFTFYGLMLFPVLSRNMVNAVFVTEDLSYSDILSQWKPYIVSQMEHLLLP